MHTTDLWAPAFMRAEQPYWARGFTVAVGRPNIIGSVINLPRIKRFLEKRAYPTLKSLAEFYLGWLVWDDKSNSWVSSPETSPENSYMANDGKPAAVSFGSAMGHQIIGEVFDNMLAAAKILGKNDDFVNEVKVKREKLHPGVVVGEDGRILEWNEPY